MGVGGREKGEREKRPRHRSSAGALRGKNCALGGRSAVPSPCNTVRCTSSMPPHIPLPPMAGLGLQSSVAAYTLGGDGAVGGGAASAILAGTGGGAAGAGGGGGGTRGVSSLQASAEHHRAHVSARRRAPFLLAICADARRRAAGGAGAGVAADGTMALCRKLFFAGERRERKRVRARTGRGASESCLHRRMLPDHRGA